MREDLTGRRYGKLTVLEFDKKVPCRGGANYYWMKQLPNHSVSQERRLQMSDEYILTAENYYDLESDRRFLSVHQYLNFVGTLGRAGCEERALAMLNGTYSEEPTEAMIVGSYVDAFFEGTLEEFKKNHKEIFTQKGELKAQYKRAEKMIERCTKDEMFMYFMSGEKQKIFTAELFGVPFKCKLDSYIPGVAIIDLKTAKSMHQAWRVEDYGYTSFPEYFGYCTQLSIYQRIVDICTGEKLPCYIAAVTKEESPEIEIIEIGQSILDDALNKVHMNLPSVMAIRNGEIPPTRCERCDYCKATKVLKRPISLMDLINEY